MHAYPFVVSENSAFFFVGSYAYSQFCDVTMKGTSIPLVCLLYYLMEVCILKFGIEEVDG